MTAGGQRLRLTRRGLSTLVPGAACVVLGGSWAYQGLLALGVGLVVAPALALALLVFGGPVRGERRLGAREVSRGTSVTSVLDLSASRGAGGGAVRVVDRIDGAPLEVATTRPAPGRGVRVDYALPMVRRGVVTVGPVYARTAGLCGLAASTVQVAGVAEVRVVPRVLAARVTSPTLRASLPGPQAAAELGGTDLAALHPYVPGDDLRRLHWATSARTGTLMVREDEEPGRARVLVLLDDSAGGADPDLFEECVDLAASLAAAALREGAVLRLATTSGRLDTEEADPPRGVAAVDRVGTDVLALLAAVDQQPAGPQGGPRLAAGRRVRRGEGHHPDLAIAVCGSLAPLAPLVATLPLAGHSAVLRVDPAGESGVSLLAGCVVARGPRAEDLAGLVATILP